MQSAARCCIHFFGRAMAVDYWLTRSWWRWGSCTEAERQIFVGLMRGSVCLACDDDAPAKSRAVGIPVILMARDGGARSARWRCPGRRGRCLAALGKTVRQANTGVGEGQLLGYGCGGGCMAGHEARMAQAAATLHSCLFAGRDIEWRGES